MIRLRWLSSVMIRFMVQVMHQQAYAAQGQGTYAIIDPYFAGDLSKLQSASLVACPQTPPATVTSPFCGTAMNTQPINGIYLKIQWCSFELYYDGTGSPPASCHYYVTPNGSNPVGLDTPNPDTESPCNTVSGFKYDTCPSTGTSAGSVLVQALKYIVLINTARRAAGLGNLQISIGLEAGQNVPLSYIFSGSGSSNYVGYADQPVLMGGSLNCARLPNVWTNTYINGYDSAIDGLISAINTYTDSSGTPLKGSVKIAKVTPITSVTNEFDMAGQLIAVVPPTDPHLTIGQGPKLSCTTSPATGAGKWLTDYKNDVYNSSTSLPDCNGYLSFAQATECVVGSSIGHVRATLKSTVRSCGRI
jgi:hypothetical protein